MINFPGKWSSYPPHHHPQPEIYYYRFYPQQGFGFGMLGENEVAVVYDGDTTLILDDIVHSQTSAPGYVMYYTWVIKNLKNNPYNQVTFLPQHTWLMDSSKEKEIWFFKEK